MVSTIGPDQQPVPGVSPQLRGLLGVWGQELQGVGGGLLGLKSGVASLPLGLNYYLLP